LDKPDRLEDGYAPFCKLIILKNRINLKPSSIKLEPWVYPYIQTEYNSRNEKELPVLFRWVEVPWEVDDANYVFYVLYDKEQMVKEEPNLVDY